MYFAVRGRSSGRVAERIESLDEFVDGELDEAFADVTVARSTFIRIAQDADANLANTSRCSLGASNSSQQFSDASGHSKFPALDRIAEGTSSSPQFSFEEPYIASMQLVVIRREEFSKPDQKMI